MIQLDGRSAYPQLCLNWNSALALVLMKARRYIRWEFCSGHLGTKK
jgi:hypothetical protein